MVYSGEMDTPVIDQTQDTAPLSPTPMNAAFKIVIVMLVISLLSVSLIFAYFFSQRKSWKVPEETMAPVASPMVDAATPDLMPDWKTYSFSVQKYSFNITSPFGSPTTALTSLSQYKDGYLFILDPKKNLFFAITTVEHCPEKLLESKKICLLPGKNFNQNEDFAQVEVNGMQAVSYYLLEPTSNSIPHVIEFQKYPIQISFAIDGVGLEQSYQQILSTFTFTK